MGLDPPSETILVLWSDGHPCPSNEIDDRIGPVDSQGWLSLHNSGIELGIGHGHGYGHGYGF